MLDPLFKPYLLECDKELSITYKMFGSAFSCNQMHINSKLQSMALNIPEGHRENTNFQIH